MPALIHLLEQAALSDLGTSYRQRSCDRSQNAQSTKASGVLRTISPRSEIVLKPNLRHDNENLSRTNMIRPSRIVYCVMYVARLIYCAAEQDVYQASIV